MNDFDTFWHEAKAALRVALQWFFLAVPMGLLCGFLGTLFHLAVEHATELRAAQPWLLFLLPVAGLLITALYKVTKCEGVGTNNVIRAVQSGEPVSILLVPAIFLGTVLTHLCGGSAGREGAALQMGGSIGWNLGTLLRLKDHDRRTATISGMTGRPVETCAAVLRLAVDLQEPVKPTERLVGDLKAAGYRLYVLSNMSREFIDFLRRFPVYGLFDGEVVSCEEHTVKPEPRIYEILLERYGLTPSETLFIDDREMNIEAAAALGIHGFVFDHRDPDAACDALRRRLLQSDCI